MSFFSNNTLLVRSKSSVKFPTTLIWGVGGSGGTGTWNTSNLNWWDGSANVPWVNGNDAVVGSGATAATITVSGFAPTVNSITTANGSLSVTFSGASIALGNSNTLVYIGGNSVTMNSVLTGAGGLLRRGGANLYLTGPNAYTGATVAAGSNTVFYGNGSALSSSSYTVTAGGTLQLDNSTSTVLNNRLNDNADFIMDGGTLRTSLKASSNWSETAGALKIVGGANGIRSGAASANYTSLLTFASLSRSSDGTIVFWGDNAGLGATTNQVKFTSAPTLTNGIIGPWALHSSGATSNINNWATYDATNGVQAFTNYTTTGESTWTGFDNVQLTAAATLTANRTVNTINLAGTTYTFTAGGYRLTVGAGGVLTTNSSTVNFGHVNFGNAAGTVTSGTAELIFFSSGAGQIHVYTTVIDNEGGGVSLVKAGSNSSFYMWNSANSYSGDTVIVQGAIVARVNNVISNGAGKGNLIVRSGAIFDLYGTNQTINGLSGEGTVTTSVTGTSTLTLGAGNATASFSGAITDTAGSRVINLTKIGTGTQTLSGSNTYTGTNSINGGSLIVSGAAITGVTASKMTSAILTNTTLTANFNTAPATGETYRLFPGSTTQTYSSVTLTGNGVSGRSATYDSSNSTLTVN